MSLARELGMTPRQVLASHTAEDLAEWQAYFKIEHEDRDKRQRDAKAEAEADRRARAQLRQR